MQELLKRLSESDSTRVRKLVESQEMGDRTPSHFFCDLKKQSNFLVPDEFLINLWRNALLLEIQRVLTASTDSNATALTQMADRKHEIRPAAGQTAASSSEFDMCDIRDEIRKMLREELCVVRRGNRHPLSRSRGNNRSRDAMLNPEKDENCLCWFHFRYGEKATRCHNPCNWK